MVLLLLLLLSHLSRVQLCDPIDGSPPGSPIPGILQARTLEWAAISFSNSGKWKVKSEREVAQSCPTLCNPMDCSLPGSSTYGIFQQEYWSGVPSPSPDNGATNILNIYDCIVYLPYPMEPPVSLKYKFIIICSIYNFSQKCYTNLSSSHSVWE